MSAHTKSSSLSESILLFLLFLQKQLESASAVLQHMRSAGDFTDADAQILGDLALRRACVQRLNQLPTFRKTLEFLGSEDIAEQRFGFAGVLDRQKQGEEIF